MSVKELIEALSLLDPEKPVLIEDADTSWLLKIKAVTDCKEHVVMWGGYE